jgi:hypothetical protein
MESMKNTPGNFGRLCALLCLGLAWHSETWGVARWAFLILGFLLAALSIWKPCVFEGPSLWWGWLGLQLQRLTSPLALGLIFFGVLTPLGFLRRSLGQDSLIAGFDPELKSYWSLFSSNEDCDFKRQF